MFSETPGYFTTHLLWTVPAAISLLVAIFMLWVKLTNDLLWTDFWVIFPFFGKMRKWVQDTHGVGDRSSWENDGMPRPESQLCSTYLDRKKDPVAGEQDFERANEYLKLTHQSDITPTSAWMWGLLIILTVAEAAGTGLLIAPFVASEITGNQMLWIGYVIALVMAAGLLGLTHFAGAQAHKFGTIRNHIGKVGKAHDDLITDTITCGDEQNTDENIEGKDRAQIAKIRYANRVLEGAHDRGTLAWVFVVVVVLASLLAGITWMRIEGLKVELTKQTAEQAQGGGSISSNPFAGIPGMDGISAVPEKVSKSSEDAKKDVAAELNNEQYSQGIAGAVVLALIYLITQGLGFLHALKHSFVGSGHRAYNLTRGETSYKTYESKYIMPVINTAQKRLEYLRTRLSENGDYRKHPSNMSCYDYLIQRRQEREGKHIHAAPHIVSVSDSTSMHDDDLFHEARKILAESDTDMRRKLLDYAADGSDKKRDRLLSVIKQIRDDEVREKEDESRKEAQLKREDEILGGRMDGNRT
ncbi:MAG TPA: hypothetical protein ENI74_09550 [Gammaproteobacteria bacterium]|nr:hypothetical protein [Gammaproteobacteria bacterium]